MEAIEAAWPALLNGASTTARIAVQAGVLALLVSFLVAALRMAAPPPVRWVLAAYVEFFRGTSAFVQIFWAYFALPFFGIRLSPEVAGVAILALNVGAYGSEVVRGALVAVPRGQFEAARALGLRPVAIYLKVIIPQALIRAILPLGNLMVDLVKGTSLLSAIAVTDLAFAGRQAASVFGAPLTIFTVVLVLYFCITGPLGWGAARLDQNLRRRMALDGAR